MTEEKRKRIAAAITVSAILLIVILAAIVIYQLVVISSTRRHEDRIKEEIEYYLEQTEQSEQTLKDLQGDWYLRQKLLEYGYHKK